jgi:uncharacterized membrane protein
MMDYNMNTTIGMGWLLLVLASILIIWIISSQINDLINYNKEILRIKESLNNRLLNGEITVDEYKELSNIINK